MSALAVAVEPPAMITAGQAVTIDKSVLQSHSPVNAPVLPDVAGAVIVPPGNTFDAKKAYRLDVARTEGR